MVSAVRQGARAGGASLLGPAGAIAAAVYLANPYFKWFNSTPQPIWAGIAAVGFIYAAYVTATGNFAIWNSVRGEDRRASTSKLQVFMWTGAVLFAYVAVLAVRWKAGQTDTLPDIPEGVLAALGISSGTAVAAQAITANAVRSGATVKPPLERDRGLAPIFQNDSDQPDIGKIQLIAWTFIAIGVFLAGALRIVSSGSTEASLPDIDPTLMVLTGLGSATYLGKKLVTTTTPVIESISRSSLSLGEGEPRLVTIQGANFGATQGGSQVLIDGTALQERPQSWSDTEITFAIPTRRPNGTAWKLATPVPVTVTVGGVQSAGSILLMLSGT